MKNILPINIISIGVNNHFRWKGGGFGIPGQSTNPQPDIVTNSFLRALLRNFNFLMSRRRTCFYCNGIAIVLNFLVSRYRNYHGIVIHFLA